MNFFAAQFEATTSYEPKNQDKTVEITYEDRFFNKRNVCIVQIDKMEDGRVEVVFHGYENGESKKMKVMKVGKSVRLREIVKGTHPEWLLFDCHVGGIMQLGGFWVLDRKKICFKNIGEDFESSAEFLGHVTHLQMSNTTAVQMESALSLMKKITGFAVFGKLFSSREDFGQLCSLRSLRSFDIELTEKSSISYDDVINLVQNTQFEQIILRNFRGTRKSLVCALYRAETVERADKCMAVYGLRCYDGPGKTHFFRNGSSYHLDAMQLFVSAKHNCTHDGGRSVARLLVTDIFDNGKVQKINMVNALDDKGLEDPIYVGWQEGDVNVYHDLET